MRKDGLRPPAGFQENSRDARPQLAPIPPIALLIISTGLLGTPVVARADLIINAIFDGGEASANLKGGGDLVTIFDTAIAYWEDAFKDPNDRWVVDLRYR